MNFNRFAVAALVSVIGMGAAHAQVATLAGMEGTVLVSQGDAMAAGSNGQSLAVGQRIVTTAGARVSVNYANGCKVNLAENQRFVVADSSNCSALASAVTGTGVAGTTGGAGVAGAAGGTGAAGGAAASGGLLAGAGGGLSAAAVIGGVAVVGGAVALAKRASDASGF